MADIDGRRPLSGILSELLDRMAYAETTLTQMAKRNRPGDNRKRLAATAAGVSLAASYVRDALAEAGQHDRLASMIADALIAAGVRPALPEPGPGLQPDGSAIDAAGQRWQWTGQEWVRDQ